MKTAAVIAEYNPFHNGHQFHLECTRSLTGADYVVAVMSGDFVQRGQCAVTDKYARTRMALLGGADLVLELPALFACGSAGDFAAGAVALLDGLGVADALCFGSECGDIAPFLRAASLLCAESPAFQAALQGRLKEGWSFPKARAAALFLLPQQHPGAGILPVPDQTRQRDQTRHRQTGRDSLWGNGAPGAGRFRPDGSDTALSLRPGAAPPAGVCGGLRPADTCARLRHPSVCGNHRQADGPRRRQPSARKGR